MKRTLGTKNKLRAVRHARVRAKVKGTATRPRLSVFRSLKSMTAQLVDDQNGQTLCYVNTRSLTDTKIEKNDKYSAKTALAYSAGKQLAELAKAKGIKAVVFDRGGYRFHGRVAALAEGARAGGLEF